jgi:DnaK suppressor protein
MKPELIKKFRDLFEEQRKTLVYSKTLVNKDFEIQKDDMLDETDWTAMELESNMRMRLRNRETLFLKKIDEALERISQGRFGECESCEEEIDLKRLEARPTATLCVHCKEEQERIEQLHIDGHQHKSVGRKLRLA